MKNYIRPGEVTWILDRRRREEANRAALEALPGQIVMLATGVLIGFIIGMAIGIIK